jgi:cytochrome c5
VLPGALIACSGSHSGSAERPVNDALIIAQSDSLIAELAGQPFAELSPTQRWKTIASLGRGLTPAEFDPADLPEPTSPGAAVLQTYCTQCHWLPTPQLHSAAEWPIIVRAMVLRMRLLETRVRGPLLERLGAQNLRSSVTFRAVPEPDQLDSLRAYLVRNAFPVVGTGELPPGPRTSLFEDKCSVCHQAPSPRAHTSAEWKLVVPHMQENMHLMQVDTLTSDQLHTIEGLLGQFGKKGGTGS